MLFCHETTSKPAGSLRQTVPRQRVMRSRFSRQVQKYTEITELNATIVHEFIEKIVVYKATKDDAGHRIQHIRIYYNFLGDVEIPDEWLDDEQDAGAPDENEQEETA